jgi:hypothetical protein
MRGALLGNFEFADELEGLTYGARLGEDFYLMPFADQKEGGAVLFGEGDKLDPVTAIEHGGLRVNVAPRRPDKDLTE